jgi:hypothetical protein
MTFIDGSAAVAATLTELLDFQQCALHSCWNFSNLPFHFCWISSISLLGCAPLLLEFQHCAAAQSLEFQQRAT